MIVNECWTYPLSCLVIRSFIGLRVLKGHDRVSEQQIEMTPP